MASRHKSRSTDSGSKAYMCDVCKRSFARSDMMTRHMRTHARYELQDSTSIDETAPNASPLGGTDSPLPGSGSRSLGSGPGTSRSVSSESADIPPLIQQQQQVPV